MSTLRAIARPVTRFLRWALDMDSFWISEHDCLIACIRCHEFFDPHEQHVCPECEQCGRPIA